MDVSKNAMPGPDRPRRAVLKRWIFGSAVVVTGTVVGRAVWHIGSEIRNDAALPPSVPLEENWLDDASGMNATQLDGIVGLDAQYNVPAEGVGGTRVHCIGGSRHSMGGQTLAPGSVHIATALKALPRERLEISTDRTEYRAPAGATWSQAIDGLNATGLSVSVMQSNNDFSLGGSVSVNAHGWQTLKGPLGSTVRALTLRMADGERVRCSRSVNAELFSLAVGGLGLFGLIEDVTLSCVPNARYSAETFRCKPEAYASLWSEKVARNPDGRLCYGRLRVSSKRFLEEALFTVFAEGSSSRSMNDANGANGAQEGESKTTQEVLERIARAVFRGSAESEYGKRLRWDLERIVGSESGTLDTRNAILNRSAKFFANHDPGRTDILHESFVPRDRFLPFVESLKRILPRHRVDLLNVTVRDVARDTTAFLNYADEDLFAFVFLFHIERSPQGDARLRDCVREIIDATLELGGNFYLPYRTYASRAQLERAYPQIHRFAQLKAQLDPKRVWDNAFARHYGI